MDCRPMKSQVQRVTVTIANIPDQPPEMLVTVMLSVGDNS